MATKRHKKRKTGLAKKVLRLRFVNFVISCGKTWIERSFRALNVACDLMPMRANCMASSDRAPTACEH